MAQSKSKIIGAVIDDSKPSHSSNRRLKKPRYKSFKLEKRIKYTAPITPGAIRLMRETLAMMKKHWRVIGGISVVYALLYLLFVRSISGGVDFQALKETVETTAYDVLGQDKFGGLTSALGIFSVLVTTPTGLSEANPAASFYQMCFFIIYLLALIWALRQLQAGQKITVKESYYRGMYPLVPFILVIVVIALQSLPIVFGNLLFSIVQDPESPIALSLAEQVLTGLVWFLLFVASLYMISGSVFALIVVTLADMTPIRALRGAYDLVRFRRFVVMRRLLVLMAILLVSMVVIMIPALLWLVDVAYIIYTAWSVFAITFLITFVYTMYRRMLPKT